MAACAFDSAAHAINSSIRINYCENILSCRIHESTHRILQSEAYMAKSLMTCERCILSRKLNGQQEDEDVVKWLMHALDERLREQS